MASTAAARRESPCDSPSVVGCQPLDDSMATVARVLLEDSQGAALATSSSQLEVDRSVVRTVRPDDNGFFGDGIVVVASSSPAEADVRTVAVEDSARAGVGVFGARLSMAGSRIRCASFAIDGEPNGGADFVLHDGGDNLCGCPEALESCKVVSAGLAPPGLSP